MALRRSDRINRVRVILKKEYTRKSVIWYDESMCHNHKRFLSTHCYLVWPIRNLHSYFMSCHWASRAYLCRCRSSWALSFDICIWTFRVCHRPNTFRVYKDFLFAREHKIACKYVPKKERENQVSTLFVQIILPPIAFFYRIPFTN